jgi:septal ring factor EnvC (AmiA/AmiB activator)
MYGHSDYDPETCSYVANHYFVVLFIPIFPIGRYRVISDGTQYRFLGRLPLRKGDWWHVGGAFAALLAAMVAMNSGTSTPSYSSGTTSSRASSAVPSTTFAHREDELSRASQRSGLKSRIDSGRSRLAKLETKLKPLNEQLAKLDARIQSLNTELSSLRAQHSAGVEIDIDAYNRQVDTYNRLILKRRALISSSESTFKTYDQLLEENKSLVARYNALLSH